MAAIAPDTTESAAPGLARVLRRDVGTRHGRADRGPRAGHGSAHRDRPGLHAGRRRARRGRGEGGPAGLGRDELPGAGPHPAPRGRHLRGQPRRVRHMDAARDRRLPQQDAPRVELRLPGDPQRGDAAVPAVRLAHAVGGQGPALHGPTGPGRGHRRDHAVELAVGAGHARRRAGAGARQRRRPQAGPADTGRRRRDVRRGLPGGGPARGPAPGRRRWGRRRRGAGDRPEHPGRVVHRLDGRRPAGRPAGRRHAQEGLARARWEQRVHRPRRRRSRRGRGRRRLLRVPVPGPGLLRGRPAPRPPQRRRRRTSRPSPRRRSACARATRIARMSSSGRSSTRSRSPASTGSSSARSRPAPS